jgi:hypothetical protein
MYLFLLFVFLRFPFGNGVTIVLLTAAAEATYKFATPPAAAF